MSWTQPKPAKSRHEGKHEKEKRRCQSAALYFVDELVISKLCSARWLMNGDTKQILHLLKVCSSVWEEEAKPWILTAGKEGNSQAEFSLHTVREGKVTQGGRHGRVSLDLGNSSVWQCGKGPGRCWTMTTNSPRLHASLTMEQINLHNYNGRSDGEGG